LFASQSSTITIKGGTFVPFSPPYHYLAEVTRPAFARFGIHIETELKRWGWMEAGGGIVTVAVEPTPILHPAQFEPIAEKEVNGLAAVTNLPSHIPHRMARRAHNLLAEAGLAPQVDALREKGDGPGAGIVLWRPQAGFSALGRKGLPAQKVAQAAVAKLLSFMDNGVAVDRYLADQLLIPMALAPGQSSFTTDSISNHLLTNVELLRHWLGVPITIEGAPGATGRIRVNGIGYRSSGQEK